MEGSSVTTAITKYDGIFKFVSTKQAQEPFLKARKLFASGNFAEGERELQIALKNCANVEDTATVKLVISEVKRCKALVISDDVSPIQPNWREVRKI